MNRTTRRTVASLPPAEIYDAEISCWPWQKLIEQCTSIVADVAPRNGVVIDYMCGTGSMLAALKKRRPDLVLFGCDISRDYIRLAKSKCNSISYHVANASRWEPPVTADVITATAGIHHLEWALQKRFIAKMHKELRRSGYVVIGEEVIGPSRGRLSRERQVVEFFSAILPEILERRPSQSVIRASLDVFANDLLVRGEFKRDIETMKAMLARQFSVTKTVRVWPSRERGFGDYLIVGKKL